MERKGRLNIIEPWEYGTDKSIGVSIVDRYNNQYLLQLDNPFTIKEHSYNYFIFRLIGENKDLIDIKIGGTFPIEIVYKKDVTKTNFSKYKIDDFRSNFLSGEILL